MSAIQAAAEKTLKILRVEATVIVTPSTISFEDISSPSEAEKIQKAFVSSGMESLGICDMQELGMGEGFSLTLVY